MKSILTLFLVLAYIFSNAQTTYFIDNISGNDNNNGKSKFKAWQSLAKVSNTNFKPGDLILLANGQEFFGSIEWTNISGAKSKPIIITNYEVSGTTIKPIINAKDQLGGIVLINCSHIKVDGLTIIANGGKTTKNIKKGMRCGVLVTTSKAGVFQNISL